MKIVKKADYGSSADRDSSVGQVYRVGLSSRLLGLFVFGRLEGHKHVSWVSFLGDLRSAVWQRGPFRFLFLAYGKQQYLKHTESSNTYKKADDCCSLYLELAVDQRYEAELATLEAQRAAEEAAFCLELHCYQLHGADAPSANRTSSSRSSTMCTWSNLLH